jgi:hypothetical protein
VPTRSQWMRLRHADELAKSAAAAIKRPGLPISSRLSGGRSISELSAGS